MKNEIPHVLVILGPTASGKTNLACAAALKLNGEVISADSRQIYQFMDVGTGKDLNEYRIDDVEIPYHLINTKDPGYKYNIAEFQTDFYAALAAVHACEKIPILCGGSGLYIEAALKGHSFLGIPMNSVRQEELEQMDERQLKMLFEQLSDHVKESLNSETKRRMIRAIIIQEYLDANPDFKTNKKPEFQYTIVGLDIDREQRRQKITDRLNDRLNNGLIEEVEWLLRHYLTHKDLDYYGLEYKWVGMYLRQEITKEELQKGLTIAIQQFSKRQMTWFRRMEKNGYRIHWVNGQLSLQKKVDELLKFYLHQIPLK